MAQVWAHSLPNHGPAFWEPYSAHREAVSRYASLFASAFDAAVWGEWLGRWHDLGKLAVEWQEYLRSTADPDASEEDAVHSRRVPHATFGARHAVQVIPTLAGQLLAFCIAGHHAGLADAGPIGMESSLAFRLDSTRQTIPDVKPPAELVPDLLPPAALKLPWPPPKKAAELGFAVAFFGRMLFSCLVDADRTATEEFCNPPLALMRKAEKPTLEQLRIRLDEFLEVMQRDADRTPVNLIRAAVLRECFRAATSPSGFFSLNVPTGGGKTFASLAFALHHAAANPPVIADTLRRVIVAIPYTSIIEQTADQYRRALGSLADLGLIEHHSNLNPTVNTLRNKLASENWDAPLIVTTNVQLFESLFASKTTPSRKLHRLANSIIILDEAQTVPVDLLAPTLAALRELVERYCCTIVLCTATQPALEYRLSEFEIGLKKVTPIVADVNALHDSLKRVTVERIGKRTDAELVERLMSEQQVLCIVNTKAHAAKIYDSVAAAEKNPKHCFHLSTSMCPQHRREKLRRIRRVLYRNILATKEGKKSWPCRVISTQLIEAGVDVDFPCVYRAAAGFDSIAQAAGRCNREGKLVDDSNNKLLGRVFVFDAESPPPRGPQLAAANVASQIALSHSDPLTPSAVEAYFKLYYWNRSGAHAWDDKQILSNFEYDPQNVLSHRKLAPLNFKTASADYKLIPDAQTNILVPYNDEARKLIGMLMTGKPIDFTFYRRVQHYCVGVYDHQLKELSANQNLLPHAETGLLYLANPDAYSQRKGLLTDVAGIGAENLMV